jgi:two-component system, OmpR family, response regulator MprA
MTATACILVVDDEASMRSLLRMTLTRNGFTVVLAENGEQALTVLGAQQIDMVISDVAMPCMNGYQLFEAIRERGGENIYYTILPVVLLSARNMDSDIRFGKRLGVDDYLIKPVTERDILAVIAGKLRARKQTRESLLSDSRMIRMSSDDLDDELVFVIEQHRVVINCAEHKVIIDNSEELIISARAVFLMELLARRPNRVVSIPELVKITHELETDECEGGNLLRPLVRRIRNELKKYGLDRYIQNVRGRGYMLVTGNGVDTPYM